MPLEKADLTELRASEKEIIDRVIDQMSDWSAAAISNYSHKDMPWLAWRGEFNPFASRPIYQNACGIDWIYTYYISKFPVLNALEKVLALEVEALEVHADV